MDIKSILLIVIGITYASCKQLLLLAPPIFLNPYYKEKFTEVIPFYVNYVNNVTGKDDVVVVADAETMPYYKDKIAAEKLILGSIDDPWVRDCSTPIPSINKQFKYIGGGNLIESKFTQDVFDKFISDLNIKPGKINLYLDGGNLVNNNGDKVTTTRKFLTDNNLSEAEGIKALKDNLGVKYVSVLTPDEPKLGHSDGMAAYVCNNTIYMQRQPAPNHTVYKNELTKGCPHCTIIEVDGFYDDSVYKEGYASSCGVYVNCVVTDEYIYMPLFNHTKDVQALEKFKQNPCGKKVIPINVEPVCKMGGSLRCLSWQTSGTDAKKILEKAQEKKSSNSQQLGSLTQVFFLTFLFLFLAN